VKPTSRGGSIAAGLLAAFLLSAAPARAETDIGLLAALLGGSHVGADNPAPVSGLVPGALLEASQIFPYGRIHLEGIPQVGASASASGPAGVSSATLSLLNAEALVNLDPHARFRLGAGVQIVNLTNYNGNNGDRDSSRVTSPLFTGVADLPVARGRYVELALQAAPNVRGILYIVTATGTPRTPKPEQGAEIDYSAAYAWVHPGATYLLGFRGLSYHTRNTDNGELVDSIVGGGLTFEARFRFGQKP